MTFYYFFKYFCIFFLLFPQAVLKRTDALDQKLIVKMPIMM